MSKLSKLTILIGFLILLLIPLPALTQAAGPGPQFKVQLETSGEIRTLAVSPNGKYALAGYADYNLKLWDIPRGKELRTFTGHTGAINSVAFSPDGKRGLSASKDGALRLWDLESGQSMKTFTGHKGPINAATFSPNGKYLISGSDDQNLILWDATSGAALVTLTGHTASVLSVAISPDGKYALSGSADTTLKLWDLGDERELRTFTGHGCAVKFVAFLPDNRTAISGSWPGNHDQEDSWTDHSLKLWDIQGESPARTMTIESFEHIRTAALAPDGSSVLLGSYQEWDDNLNSNYPANALELWDLKTGKVARSFGYESLRVAAFSHGANFALVCGDDNRFTLWDPLAGTEIKSFAGYNGTVRSVSLSPDGQTLISVSAGTQYDQTLIRFWITNSGAVKHDSPINTIVQSLAFSPDGKLALDNHLSLWDLSKFLPIRTFEKLADDDSISAAISPDGKYALSGEDWEGYGAKNTLTLWNITNGKKIRTFVGHKGDITSVAFSPDGKFALSGAASNPHWQEIAPCLILWDIKTGKLLSNFQQYRENVNTVAFSSDGKWVLSGSEAQMLKLWNAQTGRLIRNFSGHTGSVNSVVFVSGGQWILSGADDGTIKLWDSQSGREIRTFTGHSKPVNSIAISPDSRYVISGADDSTIRWWKMATGELMATVFLKPDSQEYLIWTPENFLAGSEAMIKESAYLVDGWKVYSIDKLYNVFFRPDLVAAKLGGQDISAEAAKIYLSELVSAKLTDQDLLPESNLGLTQPEITPVSGARDRNTSPEPIVVSTDIPGAASATLSLLLRFLQERVFRESFQIAILDNGIELNMTLFVIFLLITLFMGSLTCLLLWQALGINQGTIKPAGKIRWVSGWILIGIGMLSTGILVWGAVVKGLTTNLIFSISLILIILESGWLLHGFCPRKIKTSRPDSSGQNTPSEFQKWLILGFATLWGLLNLLVLGQFLGFFELHPAINHNPDLYWFAFKNSSLVILAVLMLSLLLLVYFTIRYITKVIGGRVSSVGKTQRITGWILIGLGAALLGMCVSNLWIPYLSQPPITIAAALILLEAGWLTRGYQLKRLARSPKWSAITIGVLFMLFNLTFITAVSFAFWDLDQKFIPMNQTGNITTTETATGVNQHGNSTPPEPTTDVNRNSETPTPDTPPAPTGR